MAGTAGGTDGRAAIEAWVLATLPRAAAFARTLVRDPTAADDVVQECYCRVIAKAAVYDLPRDGTRILFRAITHAAIDTARARRDAELADADPPDGREPDPADAAAGKELEAALDAALAALPPAQRAAVQLKALGHTLQEIADAVGVSAVHAGVLVHRGRQALLKFIPQSEGDRS